MTADQEISEAEKHLSAKQPAQARTLLERVISTHGDRADALTLLARTYIASSQSAQARQTLQAAISCDPTYGPAHYYLARLTQQTRNLQEAEALYRTAIECPQPPKDAFVQLANLLFQKQAQFEALEIMLQAEAAYPQDSELTFIRGRLAASSTPLWHIPMLADTKRNDAYEAAINLIVKPGDIVLDIGTGSGLLALMAARAGAGHVYACEGNALMAELARKIIIHNGYSDRITILPKHSTSLIVGRDLPQKADVLTTEIFDNALVGEGALPTLRHAWAELLVPDARIIPDSATLYGCLVSCPHHRDFHEVGTVNGFDLRAMTALAHTLGYKDMDADGVESDARYLSDAAVLQRFDFAASPPQTFQSQTEVTLLEAGELHSIALWFDLNLADGIVFSTKNTKPHQHWRKAYQILPNILTGDAGQKAKIDMRYDRYFDFAVTLSP